MPFTARAPHLYMQMVLQQPTVRVPTWINQEAKAGEVTELQMHLQMGPFLGSMQLGVGSDPQSHHEDDGALAPTTLCPTPDALCCAHMNWEVTQAERKRKCKYMQEFGLTASPCSLPSNLTPLLARIHEHKRAGEPQTQGHKVTHLYHTKWAEKYKLPQDTSVPGILPSWTHTEASLSSQLHITFFLI